MAAVKYILSLVLILLLQITVKAEGITDLSLHEQLQVQTANSITYKNHEGVFYFNEVPFVNTADIVEIQETVNERFPELRQIEVTLTEAGASRNYEVCPRNLGRNIAVVINGEIVSAPVMRAPAKEKIIITF